MGFGQSKEVRDSSRAQIPKGLKTSSIRKRQLQMRRDSLEKKRRDSCSNLTEIDENPMTLGDSIMIELFHQGVLLEFDVSQSGNVRSFELIDVRHKFLYSYVIELTAEQILIPLCIAVKVPTEDAILHLTKGDSFFLRILKRQLAKPWFIVAGKLNVWNSEAINEGWTIEITDHHTWSTSSNL
jgi:hypothetical protein